MGKLFESLKKYFEETPKEVLDNDWKELEYLNEIGPDVDELVNIAIADYKLRHKEYMEDYKLIDLGLPSGTLWMDRNIGASSPTDFGFYFAWGDTTGYTADEVGKAKQFSWDGYKHCNGSETTLTKYCSKSSYGNEGYTGSLVTLQQCDDTAYQFTDGKCQMPTKKQIQELIDYTTYEWTTIDGINGGLFTSKINGNSIFVPADGCCFDDSVYNDGVNSYLWSSSLYDGSNGRAWDLYFNDEVVNCYCGSIIDGFSVRGIM